MNNPILEKTFLEVLLSNLIDFKSELFSFLENLNDYDGQKRLELIHWIGVHTEEINTNLNKFNISLSIIGIFNKNENIFSSLPKIFLRKGNLTIEYSVGIFFNKFKIYSTSKDYIELEPRLNIPHLNTTEEYQLISEMVNIVTAELTQHNFHSSLLLEQKNKENNLNTLEINTETKKSITKLELQ